MESLKDLRKKVKEIRAAQKPLTKASAEDLMAEIKKHESAMKTAMRMENLAKAREAKKAPKEPKEEAPKKAKKEVVSIPKAEFVAEHKTLVKELKEAKPKALKKEAKKQEKELASIEKPSKTASKKKVSVSEPEPPKAKLLGAPQPEEPALLAKHRR